MASSPERSPHRAIFPELEHARGEMAERVRAHDWAATPLGPMERWPRSLRIALGICLNSRFPMFIWWGPQQVNFYNDAYVPMLGQRHPAALGRPAFEIWNEIWAVVGPQAEAVLLRGEATWNERVILMTERHGYLEETYFTWSYSPIHDDEGRIGGVFCAVVEETPRVIAERARDRLLRENETERARLREAFDRSPSFLAILRGPDHVFEYVNERYKALLGSRRLVGLPAREAVPEVSGQGFFEILDGVFRTGEPFVGNAVPVTLRREEGGPLETRYLDFVYQPMRDADGRIEGILAHGVDVTELRKSEEALAHALQAEQYARGQAEQASRMKDEFLATLSHELRTPLNAILGWAHLLRRPDIKPGELAKAAEVIERNARSQATIIEDLLDMSAIMSGKVRLDMKPVHLTDVVRAAIETAQPPAHAKSVAIAAHVGRGDMTVTGDANRLQQVLWNLLTNAVKFTPRGGRVDVYVEHAGANVEVRVQDTGEGIEPQFLPYVFDRFRQADASSARRHGGLGLGLSIVKQLVELHGGEVDVESEGHGRGTTFTVRLPLPAHAGDAAATKPQRGQAHAASEREAARGRLEGVRALVVDDERDARELVQRLLEEAGARAATAASTRDALEQLERSPFDVLVSDIGMPGEDGYELIRRVRESRGAESLPALALTAYARPEDRARVIAAGFQQHLAKPLDPARVVSLVASLVQAHASG